MSTGTTLPAAASPGVLPFSLANWRALPRLPLMIGAAALVTALAALLLWSRPSDYKVLYSRLSDRDGGAIIAAPQQMNVPYKFAEGGSALLVPSDKVAEARLRLASQGLPKGGLVGFELMDNQKFGTSQFAEQINYQRALEGELARSIESIAAVESARVHLALPTPSLFVRGQKTPSASIILTLQRGHSLDDGQVGAIVHLVSSSVPELSAKSVTVVDQGGDVCVGTQHRRLPNDAEGWKELASQFKQADGWGQVHHRLDGHPAPGAGGADDAAQAVDRDASGRRAPSGACQRAR